jgi:cyclopropane-fatty-acyl-phospholipid synthase
MKRAFKNIAARFHQADPNAGFSFEFWDGERICHGDFACPTGVTLRLKSRDAASRVATDGFLGFGEAYMAGDLEVDGDLQELLRLGFLIGFDQPPPSLWQRFLFGVQRLLTRNTSKRAGKNIAHHYERGNDFYALYLDPTMTYSCAYFRDSGESLEQAQRRKYEHIARKLRLQPGDRLLDIGCGWGGMLIHAAQRCGVTAVGATISGAQCDYARQRIQDLGLKDSIQLVLDDYRNLTGAFDKVVSIGMFEHVGKEYIPVFMDKVSRLLKKGGLGLLHTIGKDAPSGTDPWVSKYVFPGYYLPTPSEIMQEMGRVGFSILDLENLRLHYARTLDLWADNFEHNVEKVRRLFGDVFVRMWRLYLHSAAAGFKYGETRVYQVLFSKGLNNELAMTREHVYA